MPDETVRFRLRKWLVSKEFRFRQIGQFRRACLPHGGVTPGRSSRPESEQTYRPRQTRAAVRGTLPR